MSGKRAKGSVARRWAALRFSIIGGLLARPPSAGELRTELEHLAAQVWRHPTEQRGVQFAVSTIERWYYKARSAGDDPVGALERSPRKDKGRTTSIAAQLIEALRAQYREHPTWSYKLHADNLRALAELDRALGPVPSYPTIRRFMKAAGLRRKRRRKGKDDADRGHQARERRSYEAEHVGALWHLDFHHGSRKVLGGDGRWRKVYLLGVLDDRSRLCCHLQWYLAETAENLAHGLMQAFLKRGLPRALMTDNGAAMISEEIRSGLARLGILHETTLPYTPEQNAKQEILWAQVEGRLLAMLESVGELTLSQLNEATVAWAEMGYNREHHREIGLRPIDRWGGDPHVLRTCPTPDELRYAFTAETTRSVRSSDATISLGGVRWEIPWHYRHLERITLRWAFWDLSRVVMADPETAQPIARLYPLDKAGNADGRRRAVDDEALPAQARTVEPAHGQAAPLLRKLLADYAATGSVPAYLPKDEDRSNETKGECP
jgi:putative transposase